ncbi:hypothetical protein AT959_16815 [Dechloromonas denitrificans]|uniref:Uncharacterized protein n=1 Tax=Dechloromonas denitrificans TaxID=281362 RepID=A0A133XFA1_9RHOO|nr:hypothetical protein [Dechloromonas denitrificans]KXB29603.1 hypothetical protein AT959_16815 [Dechloromonas denitrificans]
MSGAFSRRNRAAAAALVFALFGQSTAAIAESGLPELGEAAQSVLTPQDERRLGEQSMEQIGAGGGYFDDPEVRRALVAGAAPGVPGGNAGGAMSVFPVASSARQIIAIQRLSVAFLDAQLKQDPIAREWLARDAGRWLEPVGELRRK